MASRRLKIAWTIFSFVLIMIIAHATLPTVGGNTNTWGTILNEHITNMTNDLNATLGQKANQTEFMNTNTTIYTRINADNTTQSSLITSNNNTLGNQQSSDNTTQNSRFNGNNQTLIDIVTGNNNTIYGSLGQKLNLTGGTIAGNLWINGSLFVLGNISNVNITNLNFNGSLYPDIDNQFDIGSSGFRWVNGFFSGDITIAGIAILARVNSNNQTLFSLESSDNTTQDNKISGNNNTIYGSLGQKVNITDANSNNNTIYGSLGGKTNLSTNTAVCGSGTAAQNVTLTNGVVTTQCSTAGSGSSSGGNITGSGIAGFFSYFFNVTHIISTMASVNGSTANFIYAYLNLTGDLFVNGLNVTGRQIADNSTTSTRIGNLETKQTADNTTLFNAETSDNTTQKNLISGLQSDNTTQSNQISGDNTTQGNLITGNNNTLAGLIGTKVNLTASASKQCTSGEYTNNVTTVGGVVTFISCFNQSASSDNTTQADAINTKANLTDLTNANNTIYGNLGQKVNLTASASKQCTGGEYIDNVTTIGGVVTSVVCKNQSSSSDNNTIYGSLGQKLNLTGGTLSGLLTINNISTVNNLSLNVSNALFVNSSTNEVGVNIANDSAPFAVYGNSGSTVITMNSMSANAFFKIGDTSNTAAGFFGTRSGQGFFQGRTSPFRIEAPGGGLDKIAVASITDGTSTYSLPTSTGTLALTSDVTSSNTTLFNLINQKVNQTGGTYQANLTILGLLNVTPVNSVNNLTFTINDTVFFNLSSRIFNVTTGISCGMITGGSDSDFCVDTSGAGGSYDDTIINQSIGKKANQTEFVNTNTTVYNRINADNTTNNDLIGTKVNNSGGSYTGNFTILGILNVTPRIANMDNITFTINDSIYFNMSQGGFLGFRTTTPKSWLDIAGNFTLGGTFFLEGFNVSQRLTSNNNTVYADLGKKVNITDWQTNNNTIQNDIGLKQNLTTANSDNTTYTQLIGTKANNTGGSYIGNFTFLGFFNITPRVADTNNITFTINDTYYFNRTNGGQIGIGTSSPNAKLSISGNATITQDLFINGVNVSGRQSSDNTTLIGLIGTKTNQTEFTNTNTTIYARIDGDNTTQNARFNGNNNTILDSLNTKLNISLNYTTTGYLNFSGNANVTLLQNISRLCLNAICTRYLYDNGTGVVIQG